ncbi:MULTISPECIES: hypothetical protein [Aerosakkonema]|uniref:hypothetical protein n=1 Tax=Aerosakkonema TaxID=1246629 RepID=UPI0035B85593
MLDFTTFAHLKQARQFAVGRSLLKVRQLQMVWPGNCLRQEFRQGVTHLGYFER